MSTIKIDKDIFVRDEFNVRRRVWPAGTTVESYVYQAILKTNKVVNPDDLPVPPQSPIPEFKGGVMETKVLPEEPASENAEKISEKPTSKKVSKKSDKKDSK